MNAQPDASSMLRALPTAMHATNATNATHSRGQDMRENTHVPNAPTPVDNPYSPTRREAKYTASDLEFAAFLASRKPWDVNKERYRTSIAEALIREYDRVTDYNLTFLRGQRIAEDTTGRKTAA